MVCSAAQVGCMQRSRTNVFPSYVTFQHNGKRERLDYEVADSSFRDPVFGSLGKIS